jgi:Tfp pilus assembly protein PilX
MIMNLRNDRGIALVLALLLMMVTSGVAAALMFLARSETLSTANYRLMSQARYGAEAGIQKAANYLLNNYTPPATTGSDPISAYVYTGVSPVTYSGAAVMLSANGSVLSNYPVPSTQTAFSNAGQGTLPAGTTTVNYKAYAKLMSMQLVNLYGGGQATIQTWLIVADGSITGLQAAQEEVTATIETPATPASNFAAFGTNGGCGSLNFGGSTVQTDSYSSSGALVGGVPVISASGGNVGTNGNLTQAGGSTINGTLSTPRVGVGSCSSGNVTAVSSGGGATVTGGVVQLPQQITMPTPAAPNPVPPTTSYSGNGQTLTNGSTWGNVTVNAGATLTLCAAAQTCTINVNSITLSGNATLVIPVGATVILNVAGTGQTTPIDFTGGSVSNASFDPSHLQITYGGTGTVKLNGGAQASAMVYAPNAAVSFSGGGDFYGSVIAATVSVTGGAKLHYDRRLAGEFFVVGNTMFSSFSWQRN